jgi:hypothetical protein
MIATISSGFPRNSRRYSEGAIIKRQGRKEVYQGVSYASCPKVKDEN